MDLPDEVFDILCVDNTVSAEKTWMKQYEPNEKYVVASIDGLCMPPPDW